MIADEWEQNIKKKIIRQKEDSLLQELLKNLLDKMNLLKYAYNFSWFGRPIIQIPQDTVTFQEMIWEVKPDLIIETGIAHGGSLVFSASMLALLETFQMVKNPRVVGIDIDIREHNRKAIEQHPASRWITMIEGSSVDPDVVKAVSSISTNHKRVMLFLDSDHTHNHVLAELKAYTPFVTPGSYCVVLDTGIENIDPSVIEPGRKWCQGNSPKSALNEFLAENDQFELDHYYHEKAWITSFPGGIIKRLMSHEK